MTLEKLENVFFVVPAKAGIKHIQVISAYIFKPSTKEIS